MIRNLHDLARQFAAMPNVQTVILQRAKPTIELLATSGMKAGFRDSMSPAGVPWAPLRFPRPQGGDKPLRNTGQLMASVSSELIGDDLYLRANAPGARLHQFGGVVRPVRAKALAIPISKEAVRVGSPRNFPRKLFVLKSHGNHQGVLAEAKVNAKRKTKDIIVHYLLRSSVVIPARPFLGMNETTSGKVALAIGREFELYAAETLLR